jgi:uncharacterized phosphosugar-binding protein
MPSENLGSRYLGAVSTYLDQIVQTQEGNVKAAAQLLKERIAHDKLIYVYGVGGHSYVGSEEFFYRAGGLANISPMFEASLALAGGGQKSTMLERVEGIGDKIVKAFQLTTGDVMIVTSAYGINACSIDAALEARRRGCKVIAITSLDFARNTPRDFRARHSSGQNLYEVADIAIDNKIPHGEVCVELEGFPQKLGGTCNILQCFCVNWLVMETVRACREAGIEPPVWCSANVVGGDEKNQQLLNRYTSRIKAL